MGGREAEEADAADAALAATQVLVGGAASPLKEEDSKAESCIESQPSAEPPPDLPLTSSESSRADPPGSLSPLRNSHSSVLVTTSTSTSSGVSVVPKLSPGLCISQKPQARCECEAQGGKNKKRGGRKKKRSSARPMSVLERTKYSPY